MSFIPQYEALGNKPQKICSYSPEPPTDHRSQVFKLKSCTRPLIIGIRRTQLYSRTSINGHLSTTGTSLHRRHQFPSSLENCSYFSILTTTISPQWVVNSVPREAVVERFDRSKFEGKKLELMLLSALIIEGVCLKWRPLKTGLTE